jgi:hypothetical protein
MRGRAGAVHAGRVRPRVRADCRRAGARPLLVCGPPDDGVASRRPARRRLHHLIGVAFLRRGAHVVWIAAFVVVLVFVARASVGLRLPERVAQSEPRAAAVSGLVSFKDRLDRGELPDTNLIVSDGCLHFAVPYLVRRPTLPAFGERQVGFVDRLPLARQAAAILAGGTEGAALAARLGVRYAVADPECVPDLAETLGGTAVVANDGVVVVRLPERR